MKKNFRQAGFSLLEGILAAGVGGLLMVGVFGTMDFQFKKTKSQSAEHDILQEIMVPINKFKTELVNTFSVSENAGEIILSLPNQSGIALNTFDVGYKIEDCTKANKTTKCLSRIDYKSGAKISFPGITDLKWCLKDNSNNEIPGSNCSYEYKAGKKLSDLIAYNTNRIFIVHFQTQFSTYQSIVMAIELNNMGNENTTKEVILIN